MAALKRSHLYKGEDTTDTGWRPNRTKIKDKDRVEWWQKNSQSQPQIVGDELSWFSPCRVHTFYDYFFYKVHTFYDSKPKTIHLCEKSQIHIILDQTFSRLNQTTKKETCPMGRHHMLGMEVPKELHISLIHFFNEECLIENYTYIDIYNAYSVNHCYENSYSYFLQSCHSYNAQPIWKSGPLNPDMTLFDHSHQRMQAKYDLYNKLKDLKKSL